MKFYVDDKDFLNPSFDRIPVRCGKDVVGYITKNAYENFYKMSTKEFYGTVSDYLEYVVRYDWWK
jgi:hypothetical protein